jgi:hypothetical protein
LKEIGDQFLIFAVLLPFRRDKSFDVLLQILGRVQRASRFFSEQ